MNNILVSIIIVNYKTKELTKNCINSLLNHHPHISLEIIVVDNNSNDGSAEYIKNLFPNVIVISMSKNLGFGYGNNIGVNNANGKFVLLLNSDTIIINDILTPFIKFHTTHSELNIGVLGSLMISSDFKVLHSFGKFPTFLRFYLDSKSHKNEATVLSKIKTNYYSEVDIVSGANMFMDKTIYDRYNGFDTNIFLYEEELELQYRMRKNNLKSIVINEKSIIHLEGRSSSNFFKRRCFFISLCYVIKKHLPLFLYCIFRLRCTIYAVIFFKNPRIGMKEKIDYLKLTLSKIN